MEYVGVVFCHSFWLAPDDYISDSASKYEINLVSVEFLRFSYIVFQKQYIMPALS